MHLLSVCLIAVICVLIVIFKGILHKPANNEQVDHADETDVGINWHVISVQVLISFGHCSETG